MNILLVLYFLILHFIDAQSFMDRDCPIDCETCLNDAVVCNKRGRLTLPERIPSTIERLTISNQVFQKTSLFSSNFSQFAPPHISLKLLIIRNCNIDIIEAHTFSALTKLESMDLSNNYNLNISSDAFSGLKLRNLLINNMNLKLSPHVFRGLVVTSLSLTRCALDNIEYETIHPLSRTLSKLFLNNNNLKVLDPKLQLVFQKLNSLDLTGNPLICNCDMKWMMDFYKEKSQNPAFNDQRLSNKHKLIPRCTSPAHISHKYITDINETEIICQSPHISELDIKFITPSKARINCSGNQVAWKAPMQISWFNTKPIKSDISYEMFINSNISSKEISIQNLKEVGQYKCVINNSMGEASVIVTINWPDIVKSYIDINDKHFISNSPNVAVTNEKSWSNIFFERRFTLLEILAAVTGTILFTGLLFILVHRFILIKCVMAKKKNKKIGLKQSNLATVSLTTSYEPALYSNSQTYDIPGSGYAGSNLQIASPNCTPQQFLDFKTQRKIYRKL